MLKEGKYTLSELRAAIQESEQKNDFKPKLGKGVENGDKNNNKKAVKDIADETGKYNPKEMEHEIILPDDRNKTTLDVDFETPPSKEWYERVKSQAKGYPSSDNEKTTDVGKNGGLEFDGNKRFYDSRVDINTRIGDAEEAEAKSGLSWRTKEKSKYIKPKMGKYIKEQTGFDFEDDNMTTSDIVAKDFITWATSEADKAPYPINAMQLVYDAYVNNDDDALEEVATAYFESKYDDMAQWDTVFDGVSKAVNAFGYYNLSNEVSEDTWDEDMPNEIGFEGNVENTEEENDEPEPLDECGGKNKVCENRKMKRLHFKNTVFLNESQILKKVPEEFKTDGNRFSVKDASGTEYIIECSVDKQFDFPRLKVVNKLNEAKVNDEFKRMKELFGYESSNYFTKTDKACESVGKLHEDLEKMRKLKD